MRRIKKIVIFTLILSIILISTVPVSAVVKISSGDEPVTFTFTTAYGFHFETTRHYYKLKESYNSGVSYIEYDYHFASSFCEYWGNNFGELIVVNPSIIDYYDKNNNRVASVTLSNMSNVLISPTWIGYRAGESNQYIKINGPTSYSKATFSVFCLKAIAGFSQKDITVTCY